MGEWKKVAEIVYSPEGYYNPCIVSKFISSNGKNIIISTSGNFATHDTSLGLNNVYRLTVIPFELSL